VITKANIKHERLGQKWDRSPVARAPRSGFPSIAVVGNGAVEQFTRAIRGLAKAAGPELEAELEGMTS